MGEKILLPKKIQPCPIVEAIVEVRFESKVEDAAIFGLIYKEVKEKYPGEVQKLPILLLPEEIRSKDSNLKYMPFYKLSKDNLSLQIGPNVISLLCSKEYIGWERFSEAIRESFKLIQKADIVKQITRLGIRYINFFEFDILKSINLQIMKKDEPLSSTETLLQVKVPSGRFINTLKVANTAKITTNKEPKEQRFGSIIDIDTEIENMEEEDFFGGMKGLLDAGHKEEKILFFDLLKPEFLKTLNPEY